MAPLVKLLSTFFYIGQFPGAPGSVATIAGLFIVIILQSSLPAYLGVLAAITVIGFLVSGRMEKQTQEKDPSCVVIDEVAGVMVAFIGLPLEWSVILAGFFLFRAFDMFKIYPVGHFEKLGGSVGIMMDDIVAGLYTNAVMHAALILANRF